MNDAAIDLNIELFASCLKATPINEGVAESNRRYFINRLKELLNCNQLINHIKQLESEKRYLEEQLNDANIRNTI